MERERTNDNMRNFEALHPRLQALASKLKEKCEEQGIKILFSECVRTIAEQDALYAQGRTKPGSIVTNAKGTTYSSQHQWGIAVDIYLDMDVDGDGNKSDDAFNNSTGLFERVGAIGVSIGLGWGGTWKSIKDRPHFDLSDWGSTTYELKNEYGTPEKFMATWSNGGVAIDKTNEKSEYERTQFIMDVQKATGSKVDGKAGKETLGNTVTVSATKNNKHKVVKAIQKRLNALGYDCGKADGIAGAKFTAAVIRYQKEVLGYKKPDGEITAKQKMWKSLLGMV